MYVYLEATGTDQFGSDRITSVWSSESSWARVMRGP